MTYDEVYMSLAATLQSGRPCSKDLTSWLGDT
jgi:hypothetical protein